MHPARARRHRADHVSPNAKTRAAPFEAAKDWQATKFDNGWAVLTWPKEYGGQGLGRLENVVFAQEEAKFRDAGRTSTASATACSGPRS